MRIIHGIVEQETIWLEFRNILACEEAIKGSFPLPQQSSLALKVNRLGEHFKMPKIFRAS
jgi:hypothetical protein